MGDRLIIDAIYRMGTVFRDFDLSGFWAVDDEYAQENYVGEPTTDEEVADVERELGYKLPASYVALLRLQNGGCPVKTCFPMEVPTSSGDDFVEIDGLMGTDRRKEWSFCGAAGNRYMIDEWGYPEIGVMIWSDGHTALFLDYRACGPQGEPEVVFVDMEGDDEEGEIVPLAPNFEAFVRGLVDDDQFYGADEEEDEEDE